MNGTDQTGSSPYSNQPGFHPPEYPGSSPEQPGVSRRAFADQLSIETPEQVALQFPVAGIGSRFVALLLDHLIQIGIAIAISVVIAIVGAAIGSRAVDSLASKWLIAGVIFGLFLLFWGYFSLFEAFWRGQTPGKRVMKLRVIKDAGRQITLFESLARNLLRVADYLPSLYLAGVITMLCNKRNKRLGDLAAGTIVIHERAEEQPLLYSGGAPRSGNSLFSLTPPALDPWRSTRGVEGLFPADAIARLSGQDLVVIEAFFARALDLPLETRAAMAYRIAGELSRKMGVSLPEGNPERALEAMAVGLRAHRRRI
jgi:uncharacterized RDD family membrane protein YckC